MRAVLIGDHHRRDRPFQSKVRVVPANPALAVGRVELVGEIKGLRIVLERYESVRKTLGHVDHASVLSAELYPDARPESGRPGSQIQDQIPERTSDATHDLRLGVGRELVVHT